MSKFYSFILLVLLITLFGGCTRNDDQRDFEREAFSTPENITETNLPNGNIVNEDPDDWRTSPRFQGFVTIIPPYPNPVFTNQNIEFRLDVIVPGTINGLIVLIIFDDNDRRIIYDEFESLQSGLYDFQIPAISFAQFGNPEGARGLHRVFIFDSNNQLISYGDVLVQ